MNSADFLDLQVRLDRIAFALSGEERETVIEARIELFDLTRKLATVRATVEAL
jgi:hypothetical protein